MNSSDLARALQAITNPINVGGSVNKNEPLVVASEKDDAPNVWKCVQSLDPLGAADAAAGS